MSELRETVCTAIENGARNHAAIIEATGLEAKQVSNILFALRQSGRVVKNVSGFMIGDVVGAKAKPQQSVEADKPNGAGGGRPAAISTVKGKARRSKRVAAKKTGQVRLPKVKRAVPAAAIPFATFGEYVVLKRRDLAEICAAVDRLRALVA